MIGVVLPGAAGKRGKTFYARQVGKAGRRGSGERIMIEILSVENMRASDAATIAGGIPGRELMLRASQGIFEAVEWKGPVAIVCGSGNNAGDGYALAGLLKEAGIPCWLVLLGDRFSPDGRYYYDRCITLGVEVRRWGDPEVLNGAATVVDCIFGTGFRGEVAGVAAEAIRAINESGAYVVSVDINSGLNGDSGMAELCVRSSLTVSVGSFQPGHFLNMAKDMMDAKVNCPIGIHPVTPAMYLLEAEDIASLFPPRTNMSHKGAFGYITLAGGSERFNGAIRLAAMASAGMRAGAGVIKVGFPRFLYDIVSPALLEATAFPLPDVEGHLAYDPEALRELASGTKALAFGMGIGQSQEALSSLRWLLDNYDGRLIIDADGLNLLSSLPDHPSLLKKARPDVVLTPHLKEFSRLSGRSIPEIQQNPVSLSRSYAKEAGCVLLLKGPATLVTDGEQVLFTDTGCPGMATAGSGDVLSGILAAVAGWMPDSLRAAAAAAWINGKAGEMAQLKTNAYSMTAGDTAACVPAVISELLKV